MQVRRERVPIKVSVNALCYSERQVLLIERAGTSFYEGWYALVSGHLEPNESIRQGLKRELKEEIGLGNVNGLRLFAILSRMYDEVTYHDFVFSLRLSSSTLLRLEPGKVARADWFPFDEIPDKTIPYVRKLIAQFMDNPDEVSIQSFDWINHALVRTDA